MKEMDLFGSLGTPVAASENIIDDGEDRKRLKDEAKAHDAQVTQYLQDNLSPAVWERMKDLTPAKRYSFGRKWCNDNWTVRNGRYGITFYTGNQEDLLDSLHLLHCCGPKEIMSRERILLVIYDRLHQVDDYDVSALVPLHKNFSLEERNEDTVRSLLVNILEDRDTWYTIETPPELPDQKYETLYGPFGITTLLTKGFNVHLTEIRKTIRVNGELLKEEWDWYKKKYKDRAYLDGDTAEDINQQILLHLAKK
jgi:hypothetical protein